MIATLKALSLLLCYPNADIRSGAPELARAIRTEALLGRSPRHRLLTFLGDVADSDLYDLQERYVQLFDRTRSLSLHLFEHIHGESRARGQALVDLAAFYERHGFEARRRELPDYLPMFLEFASLRPLAEARSLVGEIRDIVALLEQRLDARKSAYAGVFAAIGALSDRPRNVTAANAGTEIDADPDDLDALDRAWAEQPVVFGPGDSTRCDTRSCVSTVTRGARGKRQPTVAVPIRVPTRQSPSATSSGSTILRPTKAKHGGQNRCKP